MTSLTLNKTKNDNGVVDVDIQDMVIVGAGISGICAAYYYAKHCCGSGKLKQPVLLERRAQLGGTWDLFNYPGIRSDSNMTTFCFPFHPWTSPQSLGSAEQITDYMHDAVKTHGIDKYIRYKQSVTNASWDSAEKCWTIVVGKTNSEHDGSQRGHRPDPSAPVVDPAVPPKIIKTRFMYLATGYYDYVKPYEPTFPGVDKYSGTVLHPQFWDESKLPGDKTLKGKRVVVIGSGATAITTVPSIVERGAAKVYMVQRSPSYVAAVPTLNPQVIKAKKWLWFLPMSVQHTLIRWYEVFLTWALFQAAMRWPGAVRRFLLGDIRSKLSKSPQFKKKKTADASSEENLTEEEKAENAERKRKLDEAMVHFTPTYKVWKQRLCVMPGGDLLRAVGRGDVEMVTGYINGFDGQNVHITDTSRKVKAAAQELDELYNKKNNKKEQKAATTVTTDDVKEEKITLDDIDVVVTCTGMDISMGGGVMLTVDGKTVYTPDEHLQTPKSYQDQYSLPHVLNNGGNGTAANDKDNNSNNSNKQQEKKLLYRTTMSPDVPNLFTVFGYINVAWALKAVLIAEYVAKTIQRMCREGYTTVVAPRPTSVMVKKEKAKASSNGNASREEEQEEEEEERFVVNGTERSTVPFTDFSSGYIKRAIDRGLMMMNIPGTPWEARNNVVLDVVDYTLTTLMPGSRDSGLKFE